MLLLVSFGNSMATMPHGQERGRAQGHARVHDDSPRPHPGEKLKLRTFYIKRLTIGFL